MRSANKSKQDEKLFDRDYDILFLGDWRKFLFSIRVFPIVVFLITLLFFLTYWGIQTIDFLSHPQPINLSKLERPKSEMYYLRPLFLPLMFSQTLSGITLFLLSFCIYLKPHHFLLHLSKEKQAFKAVFSESTKMILAALFLLALMFAEDFLTF